MPGNAILQQIDVPIERLLADFRWQSIDFVDALTALWAPKSGFPQYTFFVSDCPNKPGGALDSQAFSRYTMRNCIKGLEAEKAPRNFPFSEPGRVEARREKRGWPLPSHLPERGRSIPPVRQVGHLPLPDREVGAKQKPRQLKWYRESSVSVRLQNEKGTLLF